MKKVSKPHPAMKTTKDNPALTVGLDVGDRYSHYCLLNEESEVVEQGRIQSTASALRRHFEGQARLRIALECGTHSPWISRLLKALGHQVIVANARKIPAITGSESKNDRNDAELLARFAAHDPKLLSPVQHRSLKRQQDLNLIRSRSTLVRARTMMANALRGLVKSAGSRLPACSTQSLPVRARAAVPPALTAAALPLIDQIALLNTQIGAMDGQIDKLAQKYPEIALLRTAPGVGPVVAAAYVLTLDRPDTAANRSAGAFLGLRPRQSQSGDSDPQRRISKTGNSYLRSLLVQSAQYILGRFGPDSALRRWGLKLAASGGKRGKKRAIVAVARKLAVLLHSMWRSGQRFQPFPQAATEKAAA
ncbi:MAG TPA: IS110 family transposase [Acidobacteriaceae bacterium]|jgi:transposase|nr:IS110 family transposase [Acidobacteriaceae bacterium]